MKYNKPNSDLRSHDKLLAFLDSLPDEFEIVHEDNICVNKYDLEDAFYLREVAKDLDGLERYAASNILLLLADKLDPPPKKWKWNLWTIGNDPRLYAKPVEWVPNDYKLWTKVGECEVEE